MTFELVFAIVTAVVTALLGVLFKDNIVPSRFIPIQNLIIAIVASILAVILGLFDTPLIAVLTSFGTAFAVGGLYDLAETPAKIRAYNLAKLNGEK